MLARLCRFLLEIFWGDFLEKQIPLHQSERQNMRFVQGPMQGIVRLPVEVERNCIADKADRRSPWTDPSSSQSVTFQ